MLEITIRADERWDEEKEVFIPSVEKMIRLEHSLVSLSKWESKWCKAFLGRQEKTYEETVDYVKCMTITQNVDPDIYNQLSPENFEEINRYIEAPMTAAYYFESPNAPKGREVIVSELIYYWMIAYNIPSQYEKWHLNRLLSLIKMCEMKNSPDKKMSVQDIAARNAALNAERKRRLGTKG